LAYQRRSFKRFLLNDSVVLITEENKEVRSILMDLSSAGAGIISGSALEADHRVKISLGESGLFNKPISGEVRVAWCKQVGVNLWHSGLDFGSDLKINLSGAQ